MEKAKGASFARTEVSSSGANANLRSSTGFSAGTTYQVDWKEGPLGLTIIPGIHSGDLPVIKRVTGKGTSSGVEFAQVGDYLISVQKKPTSGLTFEDIVDLLKTLPKPIYLQFRSSQGILSTTPKGMEPNTIQRIPSMQIQETAEINKTSDKWRKCR